MNKKLFIIFIILFSTLACDISLNTTSASQKTVDPNEVATIVARTLSSRPQSTQISIQGNQSVTQQPKVTQANTPLPTTTPTLQASVTPTQTPTSGPKSSLGEPDVKITFNNGNEGFFVDDDEYTIIDVENSALVMKSTMKVIGWHGWSMQYKKMGDFYLESIIKTRTCSGNDEYGLIFRAPNYSSGYFFALSCDGKYSLLTLTDKFRPVINWTSSADINSGSGKINILGVKAQGNHYSLFINDKLQQEIDDNSFLGQGTFGAFIAANQVPGFTIDVDGFNYWILN